MKQSETLLPALLLFVSLFSLSFTSSAQNNSLNFDGFDDIVDLTNDPLFDFERTDAFTLELWVKHTTQSTGSSATPLISKTAASTQRGYMLYVSPFNRTVRFQMVNTWPSNSIIKTENGSNILNDQQWHHVAVTYNGNSSASGVTLYIDGTNPATFDLSNTLTATMQNTNPLNLGNFATATSRLRGKMDEVRIWNVERTAGEIAANMGTELTGNEPGLIAYYKLDIPTSPCDVADCAPNALHGSRSGFGFANNTPQYHPDVPTLTDVPCGPLDEATCLPNTVTAVPTLSEWGLIILLLLMLITATVAIRQQEMGIVKD